MSNFGCLLYVAFGIFILYQVGLKGVIKDFSRLFEALLPLLAGLIVLAVIGLIGEKIKEGAFTVITLVVLMVLGIYWILSGNSIGVEDTWKVMPGKYR